jgi:hypothetical protein
MTEQMRRWCVSFCLSAVLLLAATGVPVNAYNCGSGQCGATCYDCSCVGPCSVQCYWGGSSWCWDCPCLYALSVQCDRKDGEFCEYQCCFGTDYECLVC